MLKRKEHCIKKMSAKCPFMQVKDGLHGCRPRLGSLGTLWQQKITLTYSYRWHHDDWHALVIAKRATFAVQDDTLCHSSTPYLRKDTHHSLLSVCGRAILKPPNITTRTPHSHLIQAKLWPNFWVVSPGLLVLSSLSKNIWVLFRFVLVLDLLCKFFSLALL